MVPRNRAVDVPAHPADDCRVTIAALSSRPLWMQFATSSAKWRPWRLSRRSPTPWTLPPVVLVTTGKVMVQAAWASARPPTVPKKPQASVVVGGVLFIICVAFILVKRLTLFSNLLSSQIDEIAGFSRFRPPVSNSRLRVFWTMRGYRPAGPRVSTRPPGAQPMGQPIRSSAEASRTSCPMPETPAPTATNRWPRSPPRSANGAGRCRF